MKTDPDNDDEEFTVEVVPHANPDPLAVPNLDN